MRPTWTKSKLVPCEFNLSNNICIDHWVTSQLPPLDYTSLEIYPDEFPIYQAISKYHTIDIDNIAIGFGLGELIQRIYLHLDLGKINVISPTWPMSHIFLEVENLLYSTVEYQNFNQLDFSSLLSPTADTIYIANPNGVNSHMLSQQEILQLVEKYKWVIVDEAYMEFARTNESVLPFVNTYNNLIVLKTLSKSVALPGLRLGYAISNNNVINRLQDCRPSCVAHAATVELVTHAFRLIPGHIHRMTDTRAYIESNFNTIPSNGNYVLFNGPAPVKPGVLTKEVYPGITRMSLFSRDLLRDILL